MGKKDLLSKKLFGNEAGEDEPTEILNSYFVDKPEFESFYNNENNFQIVMSRKGVGKSALLKKTQYLASSDKNNITLYLKGADLSGFQEIDSNNPLGWVNGWQQRICSILSFDIGKKLKIAMDDDSITMVEASELSGFRKRNIVSALLDRLKIKLSKLDLDIKKLVPPDYTSLLERYSKGKDLSIWLFVDDIDATFINREDQRLMISTFFSACRNIVQNVKGLKIRSSVRTDVWFIISQHDEALDKCNQYLVEIKWSTGETGKKTVD